MAVLGGSDDRENGRLFRPEVQTEQFDEAIGKFVLGAIYNGQRFGALWSQSTVLDSGSRGYGKSVFLQYLSCFLNEDFGRAAFVVLPFGRVWHTFGGRAGWGGCARSVHAPLLGHEAELTHLTIFGYPTCVSGCG